MQKSEPDTTLRGGLSGVYALLEILGRRALNVMVNMMYKTGLDLCSPSPIVKSNAS